MKITLEMLIYELATIAKNNAPVRTYPLGPVGKKGTNMFSPYPGNLKNNGIIPRIYGQNRASLLIGGPVGYAMYTETRSKKPMWQQKSLEEFVNRLTTVYGGVRK